MDRRKNNKVGRKGYNINNEIIVSLYVNDGLTMKEIGTKLGISHWTVLDRLKKSGIYKNTKHKVNHNLFSVPDAKNCYWAGFIAADGCVHRKSNFVEVELQHSDSDHLKYLCEFAERDTNLWTRERHRRGRGFKYSSVSLVSKQITEDLKNNFNIIPNKTLYIKPPVLPEELINHFIRGYIDGDGSLGWHKHNNKPRLHVVSGSKDIVLWIKNKIEEFVSVTGSPLVRSSENKHNLEYIGNQVYNILNWLYKYSTSDTRLQRKFERYQEYLKRANKIADFI